MAARQKPRQRKTVSESPVGTANQSQFVSMALGLFMRCEAGIRARPLLVPL